MNETKGNCQDKISGEDWEPSLRFVGRHLLQFDPFLVLGPEDVDMCFHMFSTINIICCEGCQYTENMPFTWGYFLLKYPWTNLKTCMYMTSLLSKTISGNLNQDC